MGDQNKNLQKKVKHALADALQTGTVGLKHLYAALFMLSTCQNYEEQVDVLGILSYDSPELNSIFVEARAMSIAI